MSATFALACFAAQANDNISNDDKNPKNKAKVVKKAETKVEPTKACTSCGYVSGWICNGVATSIGGCRTASTCAEAKKLLDAALNAADCN